MSIRQKNRNYFHLKVILAFIIIVVSVLHSYAQPDHAHVQYGSEPRQWLDIYIAPSIDPTPVYFDAHGNGGTTAMPSAIIDSLKAEGISTVAWESLTTVLTQAEVDTGWVDAELMYNWVIANAATYNFDTTCFIIGGRSRGSILSWKLAHSADPKIKGLYMINALPDGIWADSSWWYPPNEVTVNSPPLVMAYSHEPGTTDIHDPLNGYVISNKYDALGIGYRDTLIHSLDSSPNPDKYQFLIDLIRTIGCSNTAASLNNEPDELIAYRIFPNPVNDELKIIGLEGSESISIYSVDGQLNLVMNDLNDLDISSLNPGIYILHIHNNRIVCSFKIVKN